MGAPSIPSKAAPLRKDVDKLRRLPKDAKIQKRPLLHPAISSPYAGSQNQKVVYVGSKTPFMSAFKRVRQLLKQIDKRSVQSTMALQRRGRKNQVRAVAEEDAEPVIVMATGKAIDKALGLALLFQQQSDCVVKIKTGTVSAIDDIVQADENIEPSELKEDVFMIGAPAKDAEINEINNDLEGLPESRIRQASMVEVYVTLR